MKSREVGMLGWVHSLVAKLFVKTRYLPQCGLMAALFVVGCQDISNNNTTPSVIPTKAALMDDNTRRYEQVAGTKEVEKDNPSSQKQKKKQTKTPPNPRLLCKKNQDCMLLPPRPCTCPPCGDVLREAMNKKSAKELMSRWARRRCRKPVCKKCEGRYIGTKAVCIKGQCQTQ